MTIAALPKEILLSVFQNLGPTDLLQVGSVCKLFKKVAETEALWCSFGQKKSEFLKDRVLLKRITKLNPKIEDIYLNGVVDNVIPISSVEYIVFYKDYIPESINVQSGKRSDIFGTGQIIKAVSEDRILTVAPSYSGHRGTIRDVKNLKDSLYSFRLESSDYPLKALFFEDTLFIQSGRGIKVLDLKSKKFHLIKDQQNAPCLLKVHERHLFTTTVGEELFVKRLDIATEQCVQHFEGHTGKVTVFDFLQNWMLTGSEDCALKLWDIKSGKNVLSLTENLDKVSSVKFVSQNIVLSGDHKGRLHIWDLTAQKCTRIFEREDKRKVENLHFLENKILATQINDLIIRDFN